MASLQGTYVVIVTPYNEDDGVDYDGLSRNLEWYLENGVHGIIALGSTGEFASLTEEERHAVAQHVTRRVGQRVPVVLGTAAETTRKSVEYTRSAADLGASGVLIIPPWYFNPSQDEMIHHFETIADKTAAPIMIYNNPGTSGVDLSLESVSTLAKHQSIQYIKESTGDVKRIRDIKRACGDSIVTFCGADDLALESFQVGAAGWVSVIANIFPKLASQLFEAAVWQKDFDTAASIYNRLLPMCEELEYSGKLVQVAKYFLAKQGFCSPRVREPRLGLDQDHCRRLDRIFAAVQP